MFTGIIEKKSRVQALVAYRGGKRLTVEAPKGWERLPLGTSVAVDGAKVVDLTPVQVKKWQAIARTTAWKDYADKNAGCAKLLALAEKTL